MTPLQESLLKCKVNGNIVSLPPTSDGPLANYQDVRKALMNAGGTYKKNTFVFKSDAQPFMDRLTGGESVNIKKEFQFFPTPDDIADWLVEEASIKDNDIVLEPSAGDGAIVKAIHRGTHSGRPVHGYELMPENRSVLENISGFHFLGNDFFNPLQTITFDKIVANPPFNKNQDIDHIYQMWRCLKIGGRIVSVASKHWQYSENKKEKDFKRFLTEVDAEILDIEAGRFKESGTLISCCIIVLDKY